MATVKAKIKAHDESGRGRVFYQIIHRRVVRRIMTDIWATSEELECNDLITADVSLLQSIIGRLTASGNSFASDDVARNFTLRKTNNTFEEYFRRTISNMDKAGRMGGRKTYSSTLASFQKFSSGTEHMPSEITSQLISRYHGWLKNSGLMANSVAFYMRHMRAVYRMMVAEGLVTDCKPFSGISTGIARTRKRAISECELLRIKEADLSESDLMTLVRDLFMLSFYCMGMPFVDLAFLKKSDLKGDRIVYNRKKTGQTISLRINPKIREILERHPAPEGSPYVLPIIVRPGDGERLQYENALRYSNLYLKKIAIIAGVKSNITTYTPRHTWASIAKMRQVSISTISDALGHENESTTQIYLAILDHSHIDNANDLVIRGF